MQLIGFIFWIAIYTVLVIINWKNHKEHGPAFWITNLVLSVLVQLAIITMAIVVFGVIELTNTWIGGGLIGLS